MAIPEKYEDMGGGTDTATTRILLVRHGHAVCNRDDMWAGHSGCRGLTGLGRKQSAALATRLCAVIGNQPPILLASRMPRAVQTAEIIASGLGVDPAVPQLCELCEAHPGQLDSIPNSEAATAIGAETRAGFLLRVRRGLLGLPVRYPSRTIVVATHTGVINASFWVYGGAPARLPFDLRPANGSITMWEARASAWSLEGFNC